jgi:phytoene dehydrogenase-like protein
VTTVAAGPPPPGAEVDGVFVGGGHNALVAATYLAHAGVRVLVLESAPRAGGGLYGGAITLPGFHHPLGAYFSRWTPGYRIARDLDLDRHGLSTVLPDVQTALPLSSGGGLVTYRSVLATADAIAQFSKRDARRYAKEYPAFEEIALRVIAPLRFAAPLPRGERDALLEQSDLGRRFLALERRAPLDVVRDLFEHEVVRALVLFHVATRGYLPVLDVPGTGYMVAQALVASHTTVVHPGGPPAAARALVSALTSAGGAVATSSTVARIVVEDGRAAAVELADGRRVRARRFVCSSLPPALTLGRLVEARHLTPELRRVAEGAHAQEDCLFGVHLALREAPRYRGVAAHADLHRALNHCVGYESSGDLLREMVAVRAGAARGAALQGAVPSLFDPGAAPPGSATAFAWTFVPRVPEGGGPARWDGPAAAALADAVLERWRAYAPNLGSAELARAIHSPRDTERAVPSMILGDRHHGSYHPDNYDDNRPSPALSGYATPIPGLYLCGASTYPGGSFTGQPGYNAATRIARDLGVRAWWGPRTVREALG